MDNEIQSKYDRGVSPAKVTVHTTRGDFYDCPFPKGHPENPMSPDDMRQKFTDCFSFCVYPVKDGGEEMVLDLIDNIEKEENAVDALIKAVNKAFVK